MPFVGRFLVSKPATPCVDFAGCVVTPAPGSKLKAGQLVFGVSGSSPLSGGASREFNTASQEAVAAAPDGVNVVDAWSCGLDSLSKYCSSS